jgi:hypothetical protein
VPAQRPSFQSAAKLRIRQSYRGLRRLPNSVDRSGTGNAVTGKWAADARWPACNGVAFTVATGWIVGKPEATHLSVLSPTRTLVRGDRNLATEEALNKRP